MTVCGIKHVDGVCVMGKCPYFKKCCPAVWDKSGKPMTNEEWFCGLSTEEKAKRIINIAVNSDCDYRTIVEWLKQPHREE